MSRSKMSKKNLLKKTSRKKWKKNGGYKREEKRRILAAKNKGLKRVRKVKKIEVQMDEKELWGKLNELNANFAKMKELKKKQ